MARRKISLSEWEAKTFADWANNHSPAMVKAWHKAINRWFLISSDKTPYSRSLRKFRKKLRFNLVAGIFQPNLFLTLTFDRKHFNDKTESINCSAYVRDFFQALRKHGVFGTETVQGKKRNLPGIYAWRVECGTQGTRRPHIHCLIQLPKPPKIREKIIFDPKTGMYAPMAVWQWHRCWPGGKITDAKRLDSGEQSAYMIANYITKYFSKNEKKGELEPDPALYAGQRFNTSRNLVKPPPSCFKQPIEFANPQVAVKAISENIDRIQSEIQTHDNFAQREWFNVDLELIFQKRAEFMFPRYWFCGDNPATQMRDYVYQKQLEREQKLAARKAVSKKASGGGEGPPPEATFSQPAPLAENPFQIALDSGDLDKGP